MDGRSVPVSAATVENQHTSHSTIKRAPLDMKKIAKTQEWASRNAINALKRVIRKGRVSPTTNKCAIISINCLLIKEVSPFIGSNLSTAIYKGTQIVEEVTSEVAEAVDVVTTSGDFPFV